MSLRANQPPTPTARPPTPSIRSRSGTTSVHLPGMPDASVSRAKNGPCHGPVRVGISPGLHHLPQRLRKPQRRNGRPQSRLQCNQRMPDQPLVPTQPGTVLRHGNPTRNALQHVRRDPVPHRRPKHVGTSVFRSRRHQCRQAWLNPLQQQCDHGVDDDARPLRGGRVMSHHTRRGAVADQLSPAHENAPGPPARSASLPRSVQWDVLHTRSAPRPAVDARPPTHR